MNRPPPPHNLIFWLKKISKTRNMDELNEIGNAITRQISLRFPTAIDIDLSEEAIVALWNSFKEKRIHFMVDSPYQKYVGQMGP